MVPNNPKQETSPWDQFSSEIAAELEQSQRALKEITMMLEQSQIEMNKLGQRSNAATVHLQQIQAQMESTPRSDIRSAYDQTLDAQQRLFMMRGQLDKLQSDQTFMQRYVTMLTRTRDLMGGAEPARAAKGAGGGSSATLEMLVNAQEAERQRLSRQMHDGPAQALSNFILQTEIAMRLFDIDQSRAKAELNNLKQAAMSTFQKVRNYIFELRPMMLDDLGLVPTMKRYVESFKEQAGIETQLNVSGTERRMEPYLEVFTFRTLQELLTNAGKHSQATQVKVQVLIEENSVRIHVEDNGKGFDPGTIDKSGGLGIQVIKERVDMLGGTINFDSVVGQGTRVTMQLPTLLRKS